MRYTKGKEIKGENARKCKQMASDTTEKIREYKCKKFLIRTRFGPCKNGSPLSFNIFT